MFSLLWWKKRQWNSIEFYDGVNVSVIVIVFVVVVVVSVVVVVGLVVMVVEKGFGTNLNFTRKVMCQLLGHRCRRHKLAAAQPACCTFQFKYVQQQHFKILQDISKIQNNMCLSLRWKCIFKPVILF